MLSTTKFSSSMRPNVRVLSPTRGFTLIEIAVVLVIIGLLLGSIIGPLSAQQERKNVTSTKNLILEIQNSITGYIAQNGFLPCPSRGALDNGVEARTAGVGTDCVVQHGFIPNVTLAINGVVDNNNQIIDFWGQPIRYSISLTNSGGWTFVLPTLTLDTFTADPAQFEVCNAAGCGPNTNIANEVIAIIYSVGPDSNTNPTSPDQRENIIAPIDNEFVSREPSEAAGAEFDDILVWMSSNTVAFTLLESGQTD